MVKQRAGFRACFYCGGRTLSGVTSVVFSDWLLQELSVHESHHGSTFNRKLEVYPTEKVPGLQKGDSVIALCVLFKLERVQKSMEEELRSI